MDKVNRLDLATGGLFFSWLIHDLEEYVTMPGRPHPSGSRPNRPTVRVMAVLLIGRPYRQPDSQYVIPGYEDGAVRARRDQAAA